MIDPFTVSLAKEGGVAEAREVEDLPKIQAAHLERRMVAAIVEHRIYFVRAHDNKAALFADLDQRFGAAEELFGVAVGLGLPWRGRERVENIADRIVKGKALKARREAKALLATPDAGEAQPGIQARHDARATLEEVRKILVYLEVGYVEE